MVNNYIDKTVLLEGSDINGFLNDDPRRYVFWCGAGISAESPSKLPLGKEYVEFILSKFINQSFPKELRDKLEKIDSILSNYDIKIGNCLRLESVISEIDLIEKNIAPNFAQKIKFKESLSFFNEGPYNINHWLLAKLVSMGSNVVTTNYDSGIEKALKEICPNEFELKKLKEGQYLLESKDENKGKVFYIHGIAYEPAELGITYQTVSRNFAPDLLNSLDSWLENSNYFVFLGYSCGDNYDVETYFESLKQSYTTVNSCAVFVQRSEKQLSESVRRYLACFPKSYVVIRKPANLLKTVFHELEEDKELSPDDFKWKNKVANSFKVSKEMRVLVFYRICKMIGMNVSVFKYYETEKQGFDLLKKQHSGMGERLIRWTEMYSIKEDENKEACEKYIEQLKKRKTISSDKVDFYNDTSRFEINNIFTYMRDYQSLKENLPTLEELRKKIIELNGTGEIINWRISTPIHQHLKVIVNDTQNIICKQEKYEIPEELKKRAKELLSCNDLIVSIDFDRFEEINQYCVALRIKAILLTLLFGEERKKDINDCIERYTDLYAKESCVQGVMMSLFEYSCIYFLLYMQTRKYDYLMRSKNVLEDVKSLANIVKSKKALVDIEIEEAFIEDYEEYRKNS